uniref:Large ribosomal subunit protein uL18 n=1 Tax=candidate division WWE3 bacterium TaxID=2053526 RepID=A0A831Z0Y6_UNCKA
MIRDLRVLKTQRVRRVRSRIFGTAKKPRLSVFRSGKHIYAQLINDEKGITLVAASDLDLKEGTKIARAEAVGEKISQAAQKAKIREVVFDRGSYAYHGRIKAVAEGARKGGLRF